MADTTASVALPVESASMAPHRLHDLFPASVGRSGLLHAYSPKRLFGKTALVVGGAIGEGRKAVALLASEGANVAFTYAAEDLAQAERTRELVESFGCECLAIEGDLHDPEFCRIAVEETALELTMIDFLVIPPTATARPTGSAKEMVGTWLASIEANAAAAHHLASAAARYMGSRSMLVFGALTQQLIATSF